jgi:hypothetical protein
VNTVHDMASYLPPKARRVIYSLLGLLTTLELIWDVVPDGWETRLVLTAGAFGFGMAAVNTRPLPPPPPPVEAVPEFP